MSIAVVAVEGVLARPVSDNFAESHPISEGIKLMQAIKATWTVALVAAHPRRDLLDWWLSSNGVTYTYLYECTVEQWSTMTLSELRKAQLERIQGMGQHIGIYIESNGAAAAAGLSLGIATTLFYQPPHKLARFDDLPDFRSWDEIVSAVERKRSPVVPE